MNIPSVWNFRCPFHNSRSKIFKNFLQRLAFVLLWQIFNSNFPTDFIFLGPFLKISHHILSSFLMHFYWRDHDSKNCWRYKFIHYFRQQNMWDNNQLFPWRPSYLTICACSLNHYDLKVQLHELAILIRCTLWLKIIIHFSRS